ncbi:sensor histidine kinase, partial [Shewanella algae]|uniref:sensor histidine kinase n=1 Tax=Shewanella algae TaxID=38313 RepID=UPI00313AD86B
TLNWYITTFSQSTGVAVNLQVEPNHINFFEKVNLCIYRILQESLTNILRHANATKVDITLIHKNGQLNLTIKDDGVGFDMNTIDSSK